MRVQLAFIAPVIFSVARASLAVSDLEILSYSTSCSSCSRSLSGLDERAWLHLLQANAEVKLRKLRKGEKHNEAQQQQAHQQAHQQAQSGIAQTHHAAPAAKDFDKTPPVVRKLKLMAANGVAKVLPMVDSLLSDARMIRPDYFAFGGAMILNLFLVIGFLFCMRDVQQVAVHTKPAKV
mmetsp:Transcript_60123/g.130398  ORF Transcript_60123/g.130398 Transcript_60123/m.130398 type:complete len:179 (+) Transcript_60123:159-695(+)